MGESLNFEIVKNTNLEKFYTYLKNDEAVVNNEKYNKIIFIDCRKVIEYAVREIIFNKGGMRAYEDSCIAPLKENISNIKEYIPRSILHKIEYIRFAGNKYAHEIDSSFDVLNSLKYTYEFIVWYLKNIEKKLDINYSVEFIEPVNTKDRVIVNKEDYKFNEEELKLELIEMKKKLKEFDFEKNREIKELKEEIVLYKDKVMLLEEEAKIKKEEEVSLIKLKESPTLKMVDKIILENEDMLSKKSNVSLAMEQSIVLNEVRENVGIMMESIDEVVKMFSMDNVDKICNEMEFIKGRLLSFNEDDLKEIYIIYKKLASEKNNYFKVLTVNKLMLKWNLSLEKVWIKKLNRDQVLDSLYKDMLIKCNIEEEISFESEIEKVLEYTFKNSSLKEDRENKIISILNIIMDRVIDILILKFSKANNIKKVFALGKVIGNLSKNESIVLVNIMRDYYDKDDFDLADFAGTDIGIFKDILLSIEDLTKYIIFSNIIFSALEKLGIKRVLAILKSGTLVENKENIELIILLSLIAFYKEE